MKAIKIGLQASLLALTIASSSLVLAQARTDSTGSTSNQAEDKKTTTTTTTQQTETKDQAGANSQAGTNGQTSANGQAGTMAKTDAASQKTKLPVILFLVPTERSNRDISTKNGCWAKFYGGTNYTGDMLNLIGPVSIDDMNKVGPFGIDWKNKIRSLETGKAATLTVYDNVNYRDQVGQFNPGRKVSEVSKVVGFFDEFSSVKLTCSKK
jgi:hypothetical protein